MAEDVKRLARVTVVGAMVGSSASDDANAAVAEWRPSVFYRDSVTEDTEGNEVDPEREEEQWAALAAKARRDWARENPY